MRQVRAFLFRLTNLFGKKRREREMTEEIETNLQFHVAENVARGMSPEEARRQAVIQLGGVEQTKEIYRDRRSLPLLETFLQDLRYGARLLRKSPAFTIVAVLTLALGIGANTAIFSMVEWILLRPLPVPHANQITELAFQKRGGRIENQFSFATYRDIRDQSGRVFSDVFASNLGVDGLSVNGKAERIMTSYVTGNFFTGLAVQPAAGRLFVPGEGDVLGSDPVVVLGYKYWQRRFHGDPAIIGQKVSINGHPITVIGVAPKGFYGTNVSIDIQAYLPVGMLVLENVPAGLMTSRAADRVLIVMARLRPGVSIAEAQGDLTVIGRRLARQYPDTEKDLNLLVFPEVKSRPQPNIQNVVQVAAGLFLALAAMVLLLACLNVANILLVRATTRDKEMAVRAALGAARGRLVRQLLTESLLLASLGAVAGIALGAWSSHVLSNLNFNTDLPVNLAFSVDWRVFSYATMAAVLTGILVGLVPAFRLSRSDVNAALHRSGRSVVGAGNKLRSGLVVAQVAGSLMVLIAAGLFVRSLRAAQNTNLGFDPAHVVTATVDTNEVGYSEAQGLEFYRELLLRIRALPGVESATSSNSIPLGYYSSGSDLEVEGYRPGPGQPAAASLFNAVAGDYFSTLHIPIVNGRAFTDRDSKDAPYVAIVNQAFVKRFWPNLSPLGRHVTLHNDPSHSIEVVGVAADSRLDNLTGPISVNIYLPLAQHYGCCSMQTLQVRTASDPAVMMPEIERTVHALAPDLPVFDVKPMKQAIETLNGLLMFEIGAALAAIMGGLGLVLSVVGVYGVISYSAAQRTQEIGIRMALGAPRSQILGMVLRQGIWIVAAGIVAGLVLAFALARAVSDVLVVSPTDPATYLIVSAVLTVVGLAAVYVPARRTLRVDPMLALRNE